VELVVAGSRVKSLVRPLEWWEMMTPDELEKFKQIVFEKNWAGRFARPGHSLALRFFYIGVQTHTL